MPHDLLLRNCQPYDAPPGAPAVDLLVRGGRIAEQGEAAPAGVPVLDAGGRHLIPGLIDIHIHGAGGADVLDGTEEALRAMSRALAAEGVTAFVGATVTRPAEGNRHLAVAAECVGRELGGARLLGIHLEGPFVEPERRGGIPPASIYPFSRAALDELLDLAGDALRVLTVAPELPGGLELIERVVERGILASLGHTGATYEQARAGIEAGIRHVTHLYNAMPALHHRAPGPLIAVHDSPEVTVELIADGVHVDPRVIRWTRALFGERRCIIISDGMRTVGLPEGRYRYGEREFESRDGAARYLDGTLIGTSIGLLRIALRYREFTGCSLREAIDAASRLPAERLGLNAGALHAGRDADLVVLDSDFGVWATVVGGRVVYRRQDPSG